MNRQKETRRLTRWGDYTIDVSILDLMIVRQLVVELEPIESLQETLEMGEIGVPEKVTARRSQQFSQGDGELEDSAEIAANEGEVPR